MVKYYLGLIGKQFIHHLENIPQETIQVWKEKYIRRGEIQPHEVECIIQNSTATATVRTSLIIRISSSSYIWR